MFSHDMPLTDRFRFDLHSGVSLDVRLGVSLQPDPETDPRDRLTVQVTASVTGCGLSCERPCVVSGLSPGGAYG